MINVKKGILLSICIVMFLCGGVFSANPRVGLIHSDHRYSQPDFVDNFDTAFSFLGWEKPIPLSILEIDKWIEEISEYDMLIFNTCYNITEKTVDLALYETNWLEFLDAGGIMLITDTAYDFQIEWLYSIGWGASVGSEIQERQPTKVDTSHVLLKNIGKSAGVTTPWVTIGDYDEKWKPIITDNRGNAIMLVGQQGKGLIIATTYALAACSLNFQEVLLKNTWANFQPK